MPLTKLAKRSQTWFYKKEDGPAVIPTPAKKNHVWARWGNKPRGLFSQRSSCHRNVLSGNSCWPGRLLQTRNLHASSSGAVCLAQIHLKQGCFARRLVLALALGPRLGGQEHEIRRVRKVNKSTNQSKVDMALSTLRYRDFILASHSSHSSFGHRKEINI